MAMVAAMFHRARECGCHFVATSPMDESAEGFWRAAGLGPNIARFHPTELAELRGLENFQGLRVRGLQSLNYSWV